MNKIVSETRGAFSNASDLDRALTLLAERLEFNDAPPTDLLVAGGSALNMLGLVVRTTRDVDVIALVGNGPGYALRKATPLPEHLQRAAEEVADDLGLPAGWINAGPTDLLDFGLPPGTLDRAIVREYGPKLTLRFIDRTTQIHLKLYAAVDQGGRHLTDLLALAPTPEELLKAVLWARSHDPSQGFLDMVRDMLIQSGFEDVAKQV